MFHYELVFNYLVRSCLENYVLKGTLFIIYLRPPDLKKLFKSRFQDNEIEIIKIANNRFLSLVDFSFNLPLIGSLHS